MKKGSVFRGIFIIIICIICSTLVIINLRVNNWKKVFAKVTINQNNLQKSIVVKSDGVRVATLNNKGDIKLLLDMVKDKFVQNSHCELNDEICLKSNITYLYEEVKPEKVNKPDFYINSIISGQKDEWKIKFYKRNTQNKVISNVLSRGCISSGFGMRYGRMHNGIDIAAPLGTNIYSISDGKVVYSGWQKGYGKIVILKCEDNLDFVYAHCSELLVKENDLIKKGDIIAKVGSTGRSTGPHVHFEVRKNNIAINPECYLK